MSIDSQDIKQFIDLHIKAHLDQSCPGLTYSDCAEAIGQELEVFVKKVRADTVASLARAIRSSTREASIYDLADDLEKILNYKVWEADAELFLAKAIGLAPESAREPDLCKYCGKPATRFSADGVKMCAAVACANKYREE